MDNRKTGYYCHQFGLRYWHRTLDGAIRRANEFWARDFAQVIDAATGELVYGRAR